MHAFLLIRSSEGKVIGHGDLVQVAQGHNLRSQLTIHFRDGSLDEETTIFSQRDCFQLVHDHHVQKGPSFPDPIDVSIDTPTGQVRSWSSKKGKSRTDSEHLDLPQDLINGMMPAMLENISPSTAETKVSFLASSPKPRLVTLSIKPAGEDRYTIAGSPHPCEHYTIHIELGGIEGAVAGFIGKQPADIEVWVSNGKAPTFLRMKGAFYFGGPSWTAELTSPVWSN